MSFAVVTWVWLTTSNLKESIIIKLLASRQQKTFLAMAVDNVFLQANQLKENVEQ